MWQTGHIAPNFLSDVWQTSHIAPNYSHRLDQQSSFQINVNVSQTSSSIIGDIESSILTTPSMFDHPFGILIRDISPYNNNVNMFTTNNTYHGPKTVKIGNCLGIFIHNIGSADLVFPYTNITMKLNDLLHVPIKYKRTTKKRESLLAQDRTIKW